jgi:ATP-dependent helicase/nuclease subunit B
LNGSFTRGDLTAAIDSGRTVLVASRRAARAVRLAYARVARARGLDAWRTPDVLTVGAWLERTFQRMRSARSDLRLLPATHVAALWDRVVAESPPDIPIANPGGIARAAQRAWTRSILWQIDLAAIALDPGEEARTLARWIRLFREHCEARDWLPAPAVTQWLLDHGRGTGEALLLAQPEELTPLERRVFTSLAERGDDVRSIALEPPRAALEGCRARDAGEELALATDWARRQVEQGGTSIGIVVPDLAARLTRVRRTVEDCFVPGVRRLGVPASTPAVEIAAASRLGEFPLVSAALELLELVRGPATIALVSRMLLNPFVGEAQVEISARATLDRRVREDPREHLGLRDLERLASIQGCPALERRLAAVGALTRGYTQRETASVWAERLLQLLAAFGWPGERALDSDERQTVEKFREAVGLFGSLDEILGAMSYDEARREFARLTIATSFEPRTLPAPVTVIDADASAGMQFDALWITGMDAARWPPPADPDPLLPVRLQIEAGMPWANAAGSRARARRRLDTLLGSADAVIASWAQWDGDAEQRHSPWLDAISKWRQEAPTPRAYRHTLYAARPRLERIEDARAPSLVETRAPGGTRVIELQALCPFRAQAELRLHARPLGASGAEVDPIERGQLAHRALDELWRELGSRAALDALAPDVLTARVRSIVARQAQALLVGASAHRARLVAIEIELASARILELLESERARLPFRVHERPELKETLSIGGLELDLRIDRVDELESGEQVVIDYKTGTSAQVNHWYGPRPRQPQLPLYALARRQGLAGVAFARLGRGRVGFAGVASRAGVLPGIDAWPARARGAPATTWSGLLDHWHQSVERLARDFAAGIATVDPLPQACRYCELATLCRVHEQVREPDLEGSDEDD